MLAGGKQSRWPTDTCQPSNCNVHPPSLLILSTLPFTLPHHDGDRTVQAVSNTATSNKLDQQITKAKDPGNSCV